MKEGFTWLDQLLFALMLIVSSGIGIYHGIYKKQRSANEYLLGGKQMSVAPIALSLITSSLSGLTLLSLPADIYRYGITFMITAPLHVIILAVACYVYLPVFNQLQVTSIYEYFNMRYDNRIRTMASFLYIVHMIFILPIVIYLPALALSQVSAISVHYITPIVCGVCIFYTTLGGIKAAVWSDAIQFTIMFGSLILTVIIGIIGSGGFSTIIEKSSLGGRMDISYDFSITQRDTFWTATVGCFFAFLNHFGTNQGFVQKCLTLPSFKEIKRALLLATAGIVIINGLSMFSGLVMFAHYFGCDPLKLNHITTYDQLLPMYVMEISTFIPGLPGLFMSGIFSASLSALSASLNCMAAIIYQDFLSPFIPKDTTQESISRYLKLIVVILGVTCTILVYLVERLGSLLALTLSVSAFSGGPLFGLFTAGMLIPMVHSKGAYWGGLVSLTVTAWMIFGSQWYKLNGIIRYPPLPVEIGSCNGTLLNVINNTLSDVEIQTVNPNAIANRPDDQPFILYRISFYYYTLIGASLAIGVSVAISYFTERDKPLNRACLAPMVKAFIKEEESPRYCDIEKANRIMNKN